MSNLPIGGGTGRKPKSDEAAALERIAAGFVSIADAFAAACGPRVAETPKGAPKCATCAAWASLGASHGHGDCRRRSPVSVGVRHGWKEDAAAWPRTHHTHGCFDHIPAGGPLPSGLPAHEAQ
jgi:hypothetical protein